ncbi:MAG: hypothetical protein AAGA41_05095 [Pseudomonadota bacterium]
MDASGNNIRALNAPRREIEFDWQLGRYTLRYDDTTLAVEWAINGRRRVSRHDLLLLSPLFIEDAIRVDTLVQPLRRAGLFAAGAVITWFSEINAMVPLLAPALSLVSLAWLIRLVVEWRATGARTVICDSNGDEVIDIPHERTEADHRRGFEAGLRRAIEVVHQKWRDGEL